MDQNKLRELMECYRLDPDGTSDVELAALQRAADSDPAIQAQWEAVQRWDAAISVAMNDVPVPAGLAGRLLESLEPEKAVPAGGEDAHEELVVHQPDDRWWNYWSVRIAVAGAAAAVIMIVGHLAGWDDHLTANQVALQVRGWIGQMDEEAWQQSTPPSNAYRHNALRFQPTGWQTVGTSFDRNTTVFQANVPPARARAWLFVMKTGQGRLLPSRPPTVPDSTTGNLCIGVWKSGNRIYVLAVRGDQQTYRRLLRMQAIALVERASAYYL